VTKTVLSWHSHADDDAPKDFIPHHVRFDYLGGSERIRACGDVPDYNQPGGLFLESGKTSSPRSWKDSRNHLHSLAPTGTSPVVRKSSANGINSWPSQLALTFPWIRLSRCQEQTVFSVLDNSLCCTAAATARHTKTKIIRLVSLADRELGFQHNRFLKITSRMTCLSQNL